MVSCALRGAPHAQQSNLSERSKTEDFFYLWGVFLGTTDQSGAPLCVCRLINVAHTGVDKLCLQFDVFPCVLLLWNDAVCPHDEIFLFVRSNEAMATHYVTKSFALRRLVGWCFMLCRCLLICVAVL